MTIEVLVGSFLLLVAIAALYSIVLENPDPVGFAERVFRISIVMAVGFGLWVDAVNVGKHLTAS